MNEWTIFTEVKLIIVIITLNGIVYSVNIFMLKIFEFKKYLDCDWFFKNCVYYYKNFMFLACHLSMLNMSPIILTFGLEYNTSNITGRPFFSEFEWFTNRNNTKRHQNRV